MACYQNILLLNVWKQQLMQLGLSLFYCLYTIAANPYPEYASKIYLKNYNTYILSVFKISRLHFSIGTRVVSGHSNQSRETHFVKPRRFDQTKALPRKQIKCCHILLAVQEIGQSSTSYLLCSLMVLDGDRERNVYRLKIVCFTRQQGNQLSLSFGLQPAPQHSYVQ